MHKLIYTFIQYNTFGKLYLNATIVLLQRNSTHTWLWRFRMWKVRPSPYGAVNPAGSKTSCCESFIFSSVFSFIFCFHFLFISVSLSSCCFFMSLFCFHSILSCTHYGQCCISLNRNTFTLIIFVLIWVL